MEATAQASLDESVLLLERLARAGDKAARAALVRFRDATRSLHIARARECPEAFLSYVMRDEETAGAITLAPYHRQLQRFLSDDEGLTGGYKAILGHVECGKTMNITVGRVLYELGRNPAARIAIVMATKDKVKATIRLIGQYIKKSRELREVFPHLQRSKSKGDPWNTTQLTVERNSPVKDPSVQGLGIGSNVLGARLDLVILDDALTAMNTLTPDNRKGVLDYIVGTLAGRVGKTGRIWFIANAFHPEDALHKLTSATGEYGWRLMTLPVEGPVTIKDRSKVTTVCGEHGVSNWPDRWTDGYLELKKQLLGGEDHPETARLLFCQARNDGSARFQRAWINKALEAGKNLYGDQLTVKNFDPPMGWRTFTGKDLGVKKHLGADNSVDFHLAIRPDGRIQVLGLEAGRWDAAEIIKRSFESHDRYNSTIIVEDNGAQDYIRQLAKNPAIAGALGFGDADRLPILPYNTNAKTKHSPQFGVESIGAELSTGQWLIPCVEVVAEDGKYKRIQVDPEIEAWIQDMLYYDPRAHMGDRLAACWLAHQGARRRAHSWRVAEAGPAQGDGAKHFSALQAEAAAEANRKSAEQRAKDQAAAVAASAWSDINF